MAGTVPRLRTSSNARSAGALSSGDRTICRSRFENVTGLIVGDREREPFGEGGLAVMLRSRRNVSRKLMLLAALVVTCVVAVFGGPVASGAVLLLLPAHRPSVAHDLPASYVPFHKGHVDLPTGLYIREDEDIVVRGTPALIVRRTYLSNYRVSKQFGIGTTHNGEWYLVGDGTRFTWASLIFADGSRARFDRISSGSSYMNALYANSEESTPWSGALLGWTGMWWTLRRADGSTWQFRPCGPGSVCSLTESRDDDGHVIDYRHDRHGRLVKMEASRDRWIAFEYDDSDRIVHAYSSDKHFVDYEYDGRGRLTRVSSDEGIVRRYGYTDQDQMESVEDPNILITNSYDQGGHCIAQWNRFSGQAETLSFRFDYRLQDDRVVEATSTRSDGTWSRYRFNEHRQTTSETWGGEGLVPTTIAYERDAETGTETALTVTCADRRGQPLSHRSLVRPGTADWIKRDLLETHCASMARQ